MRNEKNNNKGAQAMRTLMGDLVIDIPDEKLQEDFEVISLFVDQFIAAEDEKAVIISQRGTPDKAGREVPEAVAVFADLMEAFYKNSHKITAQRVLDNITRVRELAA